MTFAIRHPEGGYFAYVHPKKGLTFTRDQSKADFFPDRDSALALWEAQKTKARSRFLKEFEKISVEDQLRRLNFHQKNWHDQHRQSLPELLAYPIIAAMPTWMRVDGEPPLFEIPDPQALTEQISLFMARSNGKWVVSQNNAEGLGLSDSCDKAPCFLSIKAGEHYLARHRFHLRDVVFVEFAAFAKAAISTDNAKLGDFENGLNSRAEGREIRFSLEESAALEAPTLKRRRGGL